MKSPLHILHLEDDPCDAKLIQAVLETEGIACATTFVQTEKDFVAALKVGGIDLVLSDFSMPGFDGLTAAEILQATSPSIPFIFVSGTLGEERGAEALKSCAADYVPKDDLVHLPAAVRHALEEDEAPPAVIPPLSREHKLAMDCLPIDGRWQTEAQLVGQTKLGNRTSCVYRDLVSAGYCEEKFVTILVMLRMQGFLRMYRVTWKMRKSYVKHSTQIGFPIQLTLL